MNNELYSQALKYFNEKDYSSAEPLCRQLLAENPDNFYVLTLCGRVLYLRYEFVESAQCFDKALLQQPKMVTLWWDKAKTCFPLGQYPEGLQWVEKCLAQPSEFSEEILAQIWYEKAKLTMTMGQRDGVMDALNQSIHLDPQPEVLATRSWIFFHELGEIKASEEDMRRASLMSNNPEQQLWSAYLSQRICNWQYLDKDMENIINTIKTNRFISNDPFSFIAFLNDPELILNSAKQYTQANYPLNPKFTPKPAHENPIKIAYLSADFHNHATMYLMADLMELHDHYQFKIYAYSYGPNIQDEMRERLIHSVDAFYEASSISDEEIAQHMHDEGIDIAVDLKGYTHGERLGIFALRPAPIQVSFLGYPATTGAEFIDYVIGDKWVTPPEIEPFFTEKIVRMPNSYQPNDRHRQINPITPSRQELGIPQNAFVFCCFNNNYKINPEIFNIWCNLLNQVPNSILWLLEDNIYAKQNLIKEAKIRGIEENRLVFAKRLPLDEHLARHRQADLFLDTLPCNAHTTASDALWAGLPVLTCPGQSFASRVGASLVSAVGLPQMIVNNLQEYEQKALFLSTHPEELNKIKQKLINQVKDSPLFDTISYCADLESAYERMYQIYRLGKEPQSFNVEDLNPMDNFI